MPEFPEVHRQVVWLRARVTGAVVDDYGFTGGHFPELKDDPARKAKLDAFFKGATLQAVTQRGKHIVMALSTGTSTSHLMHSGRWTMADEHYVSNYRHHKDPPAKKASSFWMSVKGRRLEFNEPEYRGKVHAFPGVTSAVVDDLKKLGPEIIVTPETDPAYTRAWTVDTLRKTLSGSRKAVKEMLLDQGEHTRNARLLEMAGAVTRRHAEQLADAAALQARVTVLQEGWCAPLTHIAGVRRSARAPGGVVLRT